MKNTPLPNGVEPPTFWEKIVPDWFWDFVSFGNDHILWFIGGLILILLIKFAVDRKRKQKKQINKLWLFTLFFLSKRQMMIPLVITLSKKNSAISKEQQLSLIQIREDCQKISLKKNLSERLEKEESVSLILYKFFEQLESNGELEKNDRLKKVVSDLEFIDQKLIELQILYNAEANKWNRNLWKAFIFKGLEPFKKLQLFQK